TPPAAAALAPAAAGSAAPGTIPGKSMPASLLVPPAANGGSHRPGPSDVSREYRPGEPAPGGNGAHAHRAAPGGNGAHARQAVPDGVRGTGWAHRTEKIYVVKPPAGRFHESLWEIAEDHLGDGRRYREIFELNAGRPQPDGSRLTIASLIRPGGVRRMPHEAYGRGIEEVPASPPARHSGPPHERPPSAQRAPAKHAAQPPTAPAPRASPPATQ